MLPNQINSSDLLDILFEHRNKEYGAYELRRAYNRRLLIALITTAAAVTILIAGTLILKKEVVPQSKMTVLGDHTLVDVVPPELQKPVEPIPPTLPPEQIATTAYTVPQIIKDDLITADEQPPENDKLNLTRIGNITQSGAEDIGYPAPPAGEGTGVIAAPARIGDEIDSIYNKVEIESSYPGGPAAWKRYLIKTIRYPQMAQDNGIQGPVTVQFIVDQQGSVSEVQAISGPEELKAEAVRVIGRSGKWTPAVQNGRAVKSYKRQGIIFMFSEE